MELTDAKVLSEVEHGKLQVLLEKNAVHEFRNTTFLWMLLYTGARVSEMLGVTKADLKDEGMTIFITGLKGSNSRNLPLTPFLFNRMKILIKDLDETGLPFPFGYHNARAIWLNYRPVKKKIHSLRHYRALSIYRKTKDILMVKRVLGHRSIETTMVYLDYEQGNEDMRRAFM